MQSASLLRLRRERPALLTGAGLVAIAVASAVAIAWPSLPWNAASAVPGQRAGVVVRQIEEPGTGTAVGQLAPDLEWAMPDGSLHRLSDLRGAPVIVNFWATWCVPCRAEMPALDRAARGGVRVVALDLDESPDRIDSFFDQLRITDVTPVLDVASTTAKRWGVVGLPTSYFIDADGRVRHVEIRGMDDAIIRDGLERAR